MENPTASNAPANPATNQMTPEQTKQAVFKDISAKWGKFSEQEVKALKGKSDLVSQGRLQIWPRAGPGPA